MIAAAAIQKLERYGQLGLKRRSVAEFVQSSMRDAKRSSVYALTHVDTWRTCHAALRGDAAVRRGSVHAAAVADKVSNNNDDDDDYIAGATVVTEALVYAMSFALAFVNHHVHTRLLLLLQQQQSCDDEQPVFADDTATATVLLTALKRAVLSVAHADGGSSSDVVHAGGRPACRVSASPSFTQAAAHLCGTAVECVLLLAAHDVAAVTTRTASGTVAAAAAAAAVADTSRLRSEAVVLTAAALCVLQRAAAQHPVEAVWRTRTCAALLRQQLDKQQQQQQQQQQLSSTSWRESTDTRWCAQHPLLHVLYQAVRHYGMAHCSNNNSNGTHMYSNVLSDTSLFHKLSLLHALASSAPRLCSVTCTTTTTTATAASAGRMQYLLQRLLAPVACNRATRYVVYYRGDEVQLMQCHVRNAAEYALHTTVTTPPSEADLVRTLARVGDDDAALRWRCALLLTQWHASCVFFFQSFCSHASWTAFAQEQRRAALLRQSVLRRQQRDRRRRRGRSDSVSSDGSSSSSADGDDARRRRDEHNMNDDDDDKGSGRSTHSLASRASQLSRLSTQSLQTYASFLSVLKPPRDDEDSNGGNNNGGCGGIAGSDTAARVQLHESDDGNTNLPLILLEEVVLALHATLPMTTRAVAWLRAARAPSLTWLTVAQLFAFVQRSLTMTTSTTDTASTTDVSTTTTTAHADDGGGVQTSTVAATASSRLAYAALRGVPPLFHLGNDVRYNNGRGYELLGLLFASVLSPQLESMVGCEDKDDGNNNSSSSRLVAAAADAVVDGDTSRVAAALASCMTAYELIAPQVVDARIAMVVRMAARAVRHPPPRHGGSSGGDDGDDDSEQRVQVLTEFIAAVVSRLGASNNLTLLLDAVVAHSAATATTTTTQQHDSGHDDSDDVSVLQTTLALPRVRDALATACSQLLDPELLLRQLAHYLTALCAAAPHTHKSKSTNTAVDDDEDGDDVDKDAGRRWALHAQLVLQLVATALAGVTPTAATASVTLEHNAEVELLLTRLLTRELSSSPQQQRRHSQRVKDDDGNDDEDDGQAMATRMAVAMPSRLRRRLWLHALCALHRCRHVTQLALTDVGLHDVEACVSMFEATLWHVQSHPGALVDDTVYIHDVRAAVTTSMRVRSHAAAAATRTATTTTTSSSAAALPHTSLPVVPAVLLGQLAVQRLWLAHTVHALLQSKGDNKDKYSSSSGDHHRSNAVNDKARAMTAAATATHTRELRVLADDVLRCLAAAEDDNDGGGVDDDESTRDGAAHALLLARDMTEAEWVSLAAYAKPRRVRHALVRLLAHSVRAQCGDDNNDNGHHHGGGSSRSERVAVTATTTPTAARAAVVAVVPVWLRRCLRSMTGAVLRALTDVFVTLRVTDTKNNNEDEDEKDDAEHDGCGLSQQHMPAVLTALLYAYRSVGHNAYWPALLQHSVSCITAIRKQQRQRRWQEGGVTALQHQLLALIECCLRCESRCADALRRELLLQQQQQQQQQQRRVTLSYTTTYAHALAVPLLTRADIVAVGSSDDDDGNEEMCSFDDELRCVCAQLFRRDMVRLLIDMAAASVGATEAAATATTAAAASVLAVLYSIARSCCNNNDSDDGSDSHAKDDDKDKDKDEGTAAARVHTTSVAMLFVQSVPQHLLQLHTAVMQHGGHDSKNNNNRSSSRDSECGDQDTLSMTTMHKSTSRAAAATSAAAVTVSFLCALDGALLPPLPRRGTLAATATATLHTRWLRLLRCCLARVVSPATLSSTLHSNNNNNNNNNDDDDALCKDELLCVNLLCARLLSPSPRRLTQQRRRQGQVHKRARTESNDAITDDGDDNDDNDDKEDDDAVVVRDGVQCASPLHTVATYMTTYDVARDIKDDDDDNDDDTCGAAAAAAVRAFFHALRHASAAAATATSSRRTTMAVVMRKRPMDDSRGVHEEGDGDTAAAAAAEDAVSPLSSSHTTAVARTLVRLLHADVEAGVTTMWALLSLHYAMCASATTQQQRRHGSDGDEGVSRVLAAVWSHYVPHDKHNGKKGDEAVMCAAAAAAAATATSSEARRGNAFAPVHRVAPCASVCMAQFACAALRALPTTLQLLHTISVTRHEGNSGGGGVPAAFYAFVHAVLHEAIPAAADVSTWLGSDDDARTRGATIAAAAAAFRTCCAWRGYAIATTAAQTLQQLSVSPAMRFATLQPHVRRLVSLAATRVMRVMHSMCSAQQQQQQQQEDEGATVCADDKDVGSDTNMHTACRMAVAAAAHASLWVRVAALCGVASPAYYSNDAFVAEAWLFVHAVLHEEQQQQQQPLSPEAASAALLLHDNNNNNNNSSIPRTDARVATGDEHVARRCGEVVPTQADVLAVLSLLSHTWLVHGVLWRWSPLLPGVLSTLFVTALRGAATGRYGRRVLHALSSFFYQFVKHAEDEQHEDDKSNNNNNKDTAAVAAVCRRRGRHGMVVATASSLSCAPVAFVTPATGTTRVLALAAVTASLFEVAHHHLAFFTLLSSDVDYVAADVLRLLSRRHLPRATATPIAFRDGVVLRSVGVAETTYADLTYTCVGDEDSKLLLRHAAMRIEEEEGDDAATGVARGDAAGEGGGVGGMLVTERRHIFNVA